MLNKSAATDARHSRSGKDAMLYNSAGKPFAQVESFTTKGSFNNYKYAPLGQNRELEVNGTVGVTVNISEIVVLDGELFNAVINAIANGESPVLMFTGVIEGRNESQERVTYRECTQVISKLLLRARLKNWKAGRLQRISTFRHISEVRKRDRH